MDTRPDRAEDEAAISMEEIAEAARAAEAPVAAPALAVTATKPAEAEVPVEPPPAEEPLVALAAAAADVAAATAAPAAPEIVVTPQSRPAADASTIGPVEPTLAMPAAPTVVVEPQRDPPPAPEAAPPSRRERRAQATAAAAPPPPRRRRSFGAIAAVALVALFVGGFLGWSSADTLLGHRAGAAAATPAHAAAATPVPATTRQLASLGQEMRGLRQQVKDLQGDLDRVRHTLASRPAPSAPPAAAAERTAASAPAPAARPAAPAVEAVATSHSIDPSAGGTSPAHATTAATPAPRVANPAPDSPAITASLPAPARPPALPVPAPHDLQTASLPAAATGPRDLRAGRRSDDASANAQGLRGPVLGQYSVRDIYRGRALVEGRFGINEVGVGDYLPGAGRVQAIVRQRGQWVVVTDRGRIVAGRY